LDALIDLFRFIIFSLIALGTLWFIEFIVDRSFFNDNDDDS